MPSTVFRHHIYKFFTFSSVESEVVESNSNHVHAKFCPACNKETSLSLVMGETKSVFTLVSPQTWMRNKHLHPKPRYLVTKWRNDQLVGGIPTPLKNIMKVSWDDCSQYMEK